MAPIRTKNLLLVSVAVSLIAGVAQAQTASVALGGIAGMIRDQSRNPIAGATITATKLDDSTTLMATSGIDGAYAIHDVPPGRYSVMAQMTGYQDFTVSSVTVVAGQTVDMADITLVPAGTGPYANAAHGGFWKRLAKVYADDWHDRTPDVPAARFRGYAAPESNPPFPFTVWPYGGSPVIGQSNAIAAAADDRAL